MKGAQLLLLVAPSVNDMSSQYATLRQALYDERAGLASCPFALLSLVPVKVLVVDAKSAWNSERNRFDVHTRDTSNYVTTVRRVIKTEYMINSGQQYGSLTRARIETISVSSYLELSSQ